MVGFRFKGLQKIIEYGTMNITNKTRGRQSPQKGAKNVKIRQNNFHHSTAIHERR